MSVELAIAFCVSALAVSAVCFVVIVRELLREYDDYRYIIRDEARRRRRRKN